MRAVLYSLVMPQKGVLFSFVSLVLVALLPSGSVY